jgi:uncharacterized protein YlaI
MTNECQKASYESKGIADRFITKRLRENPTLFLRSYWCKKCGHWHLTHIEDRHPKMREAS